MRCGLGRNRFYRKHCSDVGSRIDNESNIASPRGIDRLFFHKDPRGTGGVVTESAIRKRQSVRFGLGRSDHQTPSISGGGQRRVPVRANSQPALRRSTLARDVGPPSDTTCRAFIDIEYRSSRNAGNAAHGLNKALEWRINNLVPRCTMLHSAQGTAPTVNSSFPTPMFNSDPAPSGVFGPLAGSV